MVENYTKDIKGSIYHGAVISALNVGYTMLGKTLIKMSPPSLSKFDIEDRIKLKSGKKCLDPNLKNEITRSILKINKRFIAHFNW